MTDRRAVQVRPPKRIVVKVESTSHRKVIRVPTVPSTTGLTADFIDGGPP